MAKWQNHCKITFPPGPMPGEITRKVETSPTPCLCPWTHRTRVHGRLHKTPNCHIPNIWWQPMGANGHASTTPVWVKAVGKRGRAWGRQTVGNSSCCHCRVADVTPETLTGRWFCCLLSSASSSRVRDLQKHQKPMRSARRSPTNVLKHQWLWDGHRYGPKFLIFFSKSLNKNGLSKLSTHHLPPAPGRLRLHHWLHPITYQLVLQWTIERPGQTSKIPQAPYISI